MNDLRVQQETYRAQISNLQATQFQPPGSTIDSSILHRLISDIADLKKRREHSPSPSPSFVSHSFVPGEDCAPILTRSTNSLRNDELSPNFCESVFGFISDRYPFSFNNSKDGRPTRCFSTSDSSSIVKQLLSGTFDPSFPQRVSLLQYQEE